MANKKRTALRIDRDKLEAVREILGTKTISETVDAALDEILKRRQGKKLIELLDSGVLALDDPEVMQGAWRVGGRRWPTS